MLAATVAGAGAGARALPSPPETAREPSSVIAPPPHHPTLAELVGPPPEGVSPLDQFREALLFMEDMNGMPHATHTLSSNNAELLRAYRIQHGGGGSSCEQRIRALVDHAGWSEEDAAIVVLIGFVSSAIGRAVRERQPGLAALCHGATDTLARRGTQTATVAPDILIPARGLPELGLKGLFEREPRVAAFMRPAGGGEGLTITLCTPLFLVDDPSLLLTMRGALLFDNTIGAYRHVPGDVICIRSRPNALPTCHAAVLVDGEGHTPEYALPPNTQLTLEKVEQPPWIATFRRWHRFEDEDGSYFVDRRDTVHDAETNYHYPICYRQLDADHRGRARYQIVSPNHPRAGKLVNVIGYSRDETFDRIVDGCRCLTLTVSYAALPASRDSPGGASEADAEGAKLRVAAAVAAAAARAAEAAAEAAEAAAEAAEAAVQAAEAAARELLAEEDSDKVAAAARQAKRKKQKPKQKAKKSAAPSPSTQSSARAAGLGNEEDETAEADAAAEAEARLARAAATAHASHAAADERAHAEAAVAERIARQAGAEEAAALEASRRLAEEKERARAEAAGQEQERQMAMARAAADDPPDVIEIDTAELQQALDAVGTQGEVGEGGFSRVFSAQLPSLPRWGCVAIKLATNLGPSTLLREAQLLRECRHPNVLPVLGFCGDARVPCIITPLMRGGSLDDRLLPARASRLRLRRLGFAGDPWLNWQQRLSALCDAARGLLHLHTASAHGGLEILHRDVKTGNILLDGSLQPLATAGGDVPVYRAFLSDVGLAKEREVKPGSSTTHATTASDFYSRGFVCPIFLLSYQHSTKTDAYGIGISLLMILTGDPAAGLHAKWEDALFEFVDEGERNAIIQLCNEALAAARWPAAVARGLAKIVHGLCVARKPKRMPLPEALEAMEGLLHAHGGVAAQGLPIATPPVLLEEGEAAAAEDAAAVSTTRKPTALTLAMGRFANAVGDGGDAALERMQKHVNDAFLHLMKRLESKYEAQGRAALPREMSEHKKIDALTPRRGPLRGHAHTLRMWRNAAQHERGRWADPPSDDAVEGAIEGVMRELSRLGL